MAVVVAVVLVGFVSLAGLLKASAGMKNPPVGFPADPTGPLATIGGTTAQPCNSASPMHKAQDAVTLRRIGNRSL